MAFYFELDYVIDLLQLVSKYHLMADRFGQVTIKLTWNVHEIFKAVIIRGLGGIC